MSSLKKIWRSSDNLQLFKLSEGRRSQLVLLDGRKLDIVIQPRLTVEDLSDIVSSHLFLQGTDRNFFGLAHKDQNGQLLWLQPTRCVLDHQFRTGCNEIVIYHLVKFYVETVNQLHQSCAVELYFLQAQRLVLKSDIFCDNQTLKILSAYLLQIYFGDFVSDEDSAKQLSNLFANSDANIEPSSIIGFVADVTDSYKRLSGKSRGKCIICFLTTVEGLPNYGVHSYPVKDKSGQAILLGIGRKGVFELDARDKRRVRKLLLWRQLENLYYKDRKFSVEYHDQRKNSDVMVRLHSSVRLHSYFASSSHVCKSIWSLAICMHQFYLDRKSFARKRSSLALRGWDELIVDLNHNSKSILAPLPPAKCAASPLPRNRSASGCNDTSTLSSSQLNLRTSSLLDKRERLQAALTNQEMALRNLCAQESRLTGAMPDDIYASLCQGKSSPCVGASYQIRPGEMDGTVSDTCSQLLVSIELQYKIVEAAERLATDRAINRSMRRRRKDDYRKAVLKLKQLEQELMKLEQKRGISEGMSRLRLCGEAARANGRPPPLTSLHSIARSLPTSPLASLSDLTELDGLDGPTEEFDNDQTTRSNTDRERPPLPPHIRRVSLEMATPVSLPPSPRRHADSSTAGAQAPVLPFTSSSSVRASPRKRDERGYDGHNRPYRSEYRLKYFPTLSSTTLSSDSSSVYSYDADSLGPLLRKGCCIEPLSASVMPSFSQVDVHNVGAYNLAQQRTSWNHESFDNLMSMDGFYHLSANNSGGGDSGSLENSADSLVQLQLSGHQNHQNHHNARSGGTPLKVPGSRSPLVSGADGAAFYNSLDRKILKQGSLGGTLPATDRVRYRLEAN